MVFRVEFRVSVASFGAISQMVVVAILQTIALPTELPRRDPHFTRKLTRESNVCASNGLEDYVLRREQWCAHPSTASTRPLLLIGRINERKPLSLRNHVPRTERPDLETWSVRPLLN